MADRKRNLAIIGLVAGLLVLAALIVVQGTPLSKKTRLGLDLRGGVELIYEGRPTPKVPEVTPEAVDDAIETIRKRTDALGVSEPEIQRAGANQISVGLPDVQNAARAEEQVGSTAQLQFYDWEPNVIGDPNRPHPALVDAVSAGSKAKPRAEGVDLPPGGPSEEIERRFGGDQQRIREYYDRQNDSGGDKYFVFGPGRGPARRLFRPGQAQTGEGDFSERNDATASYASCKEIFDDFEGRAPAGATRRPAKGSPQRRTQCADELKALGGAAPPPGSVVRKVPRGIVVVKAEEQPGQPSTYYWVLEDDSELSGNDIENPEQNFDPQTNEPIVTMEFTDGGKRAFGRVTKRIAERGATLPRPPGGSIEETLQRFAITLDNQVVSLATIDYVENPEGISGDTGAQINGIGSIQETQDLAESLRIGALPIELKLISKTQVSASLGQKALDQGLLAGGVGLLLTLIFLVVFYRVLGVVASLTILIYAVLLFALVKLIPITMTLPGIAGTILTLAVAADANIVIFERIKEEARAGRSIPAAIAGGYGKALRTIVDANVVTIGVAFILFMLATAGVKGFAFTLGVGTIVSLFTAVLATSAILGSMSRSRLLRSRHALGAGRQRAGWRFDFSGASKWFFSMSGAILAACAIAIAGFGINFGIDFESGTRIKTPLEKPASVEQVRDTLDPLALGDAKIQELTEPELGENVMQISTSTLEPGEVNRVQRALDADYGVRTADFTASSIGPTFGAQIARTAVIAIIASLFLISIYIGMRFEFKFAVPVLIALAHDLLITSGVYALTDREVTTSTVAALLTILGYSLYDTIIVFDRIRENVPRMPRATFSQIVNRSMSEVLTRSLATSFSTAVPITALMLFGGETLKDFGFALLVGVASGTYSSVFIAAPVLTHWKEREPIYRRRRQVVMEDHDGEVPAFAEVALGDTEEAAAARGRRPAARRPRAAGPGRRAPTRTARPGVAGDAGRKPDEADRPARAPSDGDRDEAGAGAPTPVSGAPGGTAAPPGGRAAPPGGRTTSTAGAGPRKQADGDGAPKDKAGAGGEPSAEPAGTRSGDGAPRRKSKQQQRKRKKHGRR